MFLIARFEDSAFVKVYVVSSRMARCDSLMESYSFPFSAAFLEAM